MAENYSVGQILYVIPSDNPTVIPVQVIERRISETVDGTVISHIVKTPKDKAKPMRLETVKGMIFADLQQARATMVKNATAAIDGLVKKAYTMAQQAFGERPRLQRGPQPDEDDPFDVSDIVIDAHAAEPPMRSPVQEHAINGASVLDEGSVTEIDIGDGKKQRVILRNAD